jgi:2-polyprenyl-3-methyl-5-hydroxy-6-metoxy-1,4-benzoquinol methylase
VIVEQEIPKFGWHAGQKTYTGDYLHTPVITALKQSNSKTILDAGCGNGSLCAAMTDNGLACIGTDADKAGVEVARVDHPEIRFEYMLFSEDPAALLPEGAPLWDAVVSTEVVEHLYSPHELPAFAFKALRPGGIFVISTPYHGYFKNLVMALSGKLDAHFTALWHGGHIKFWSRNSLTMLLEQSGFVVEEFVGAGRFPFLWKSMILIARKPA